jgi:hypothetical protein
MKQINDIIAGKTKVRWQDKRIHGQFTRNLDEKLVEKEQFYCWLKFGGINAATESTIVASQGKALIRFLRKKLTVNAGYVNNMKKLLITLGCPIWQRMIS